MKLKELLHEKGIDLKATLIEEDDVSISIEFDGFSNFNIIVKTVDGTRYVEVEEERVEAIAERLENLLSILNQKVIK